MSDLQILEYLEKQGPANTFRLARALSIDRGHLLDIIEKLEAKGAVTVRSGMVQFLKFPREEKAIPERKERAPSAAPKLRKIEPNIVETLQSENKLLKEKLTELKETVQELEKKSSAAPKTIIRKITKTVVKKVPVIKTVIKEVPVIKTVIKKIPVTQPPFTKELWQKLRTQPQKLKISASKLLDNKLLDNIQQLKKPEFVK